jgi:hypothetical protein
MVVDVDLAHQSSLSGKVASKSSWLEMRTRYSCVRGEGIWALAIGDMRACTDGACTFLSNAFSLTDAQIQAQEITQRLSLLLPNSWRLEYTKRVVLRYRHRRYDRDCPFCCRMAGV